MSNWDTGLFDCLSDCKVCVISYFCGPCQVAQQMATVEGHECGIVDVIKVILCPICCQVATRGKIRAKYGIEGSCFNDFCMSACCGICAVTQQTRQLVLKGDKPGGCFMEK